MSKERRVYGRRSSDLPPDMLGAQGVAIIGMAGRFPGAPDVATFWQNVLAGKDSITHFTRTELEARDVSVMESNVNYVAARGVLEDADKFDAEFFGIPPREAEKMDPQHRIFLETCWSALEDAGYDSTAIDGQIGLFGGCSLNTYLLANLCHDRSVLDQITGQYQVGDFQAFMGNDKDFLTSRVAYKLNLRGPCMTVSGACATSLVAINQASVALLNYQCDMALAGGVSVTLPQRRGHLYIEGGIGSSDGVVRPFDARATGTVFSHGAGVVVLKRLEDAVADRDHIVAVIRGFAVNNDGAMKAGYMAPGVQGQADVIAAAQAMAGVKAEAIGYVEAHGTATPLGDPIEIAALTKAFRLSTEAKGFCAVGTAKANVGHLDAAAGVTGVIKTALSLSTATIPPLAHFESANPNIDFASSPFYINREAKAWATSGPRYAGVSAFGVGGVNAHAVLEEAPAATDSKPSPRSAQLLCLSARTETALQAAMHNLAKHLQENPNLPLDDVAYTLAVGRKSFAYRAAFVCATASEAAAMLSAEAVHPRSVPASTKQEVSFLLPGQGSQFAGMGASLYAAEPFYRRRMDECIEIVQSHLGYDLRAALYPADPASDEAAAAMQQTEVAQAAIFATELSLAELWLSWGIQPRAMAGHSVGEYVAAVLAGVMSREDALRLVALRGRMMQAMPRGGMVSVRLGEAELEPYLGADISIAALNAPKLSVLAGPVRALEELEVRLTRDKAGFVRLRTSHAFHSPMMDPMLDAFETETAKVTLRAPLLPYVSSVTGTWVKPEEATSPRFWAEQVRKPVLFAAALDTLMNEPGVLLEVGPGATLTTLAKPQAKSKGIATIASLPQRDEQSPAEGAALQQALKHLWLAGVTPNWTAVYAEETRHRVSLPTYAFERKRHWVEPPALVTTEEAASVAPSQAPSSLSNQEPTRDESLKDTEMPERKLRLQPIIAEVFAALSGIETRPEEMEQQFLELGFDSLLLTQATQGLQKKFGVKLTLRQIMEQYPSIASLANYLDSVLPADAFALSAKDPVAQVVATTKPVVTPIAVVSDARGGSGLERLLHEQLATMKLIFEQQVAALQTAGNMSAITPATTAIPATQPDAPRATSSSPLLDQPEVKHGAFRPPQAKARQELDEKQQDYIASLTAKYEKKTPGSKRLTGQARTHLADPRAVAGFRPQWKEMVYPLITERAKGSKLWDVDGNEYVDIVNGYGAIMFGHSPEFVLDAVREQMEKGVAIGPQSPLAGEVAALFCELTGNERVTFCNTGSEAVMAAIRVARTVTGRDRLIYFAGDYHGTFDEVLLRRTARGTVPIAPGIPAENVSNVVVLDYGTEQSLEYIRKNANEIAAVLIEPVQTRNPALQPIEFIRAVRKITEETGIAFVLDEVVTGFRAALGGVQELFGIRADMATYGKVIGGGYPIGVLSGKASFLDALDGGAWQYGDDSVPEVGVTFFAGTFVRHPLALAAARAVLRHLKEAGPPLQLELNRKTAEFAESLDSFFVACGVPSRIHHFASWFYFTFHGEARLASLLYYAMREKGIHIQEGYPCFLTTAHSQADLDAVRDAFHTTIEEMQTANVLEGRADVASAVADIPVPVFHPDALAVTPERVPTTEGQREIYFAAALSDEANCAFNESLTVRLRGRHDSERLVQALRTVLDRHDALRSTISDDGESLLIAPVFVGNVACINLSGDAAGDVAADELVMQRIAAEGREPFSLANGPLARATLFKVAEEELVLLFTAHHIVFDGASANQFLEEVATLYNRVEENARLQPLLPFSSYAMKEHERGRKGDFAENEAYWIKQFAGLAPMLDLPTDRPRPKQKSYRGATLKGTIGATLYADLKKASAKQGCTLFVTLLSGFQLLLHRLTRQPEVVVGISAAGQSLFANTSLVGHCVHFLPMLSQLSAGETAKSHLSAMRTQLFDAFDHQEFTYGSLLQKLKLPRDASRLPLIEVQFNLEKVGAAVAFNGLTSTIASNPKQFVNTDLFLNAMETKSDLAFDLDYNTDLFDEQTVQQWMAMYRTLLGEIAKDTSRCVDELAIQVDTERASLVEQWNRTEVDFGEFIPVHQIIRRRAQENPYRVAVECAGVRWTAAELEQYANRVAHKLLTEGMRPGDLVALCMTRSLELVGALLGVLKAGGVYLPLDPHHPRERLELILEDASADWLLTGIAAPALTTAAKVVALNCKLESEPVQSLENAAAANDLAYVIYTSGSTGRPKGVAVEHGALMNLLRSMEHEPGVSQRDVLVAVTTLAFDIAGLELLLPLMTGARLVLATNEQLSDGFQLLRLLERSQATVMQATPGTWRMLIDAGWKSDPALAVLCGGEALPRDLADQLLERSSKVWNMYGPTETTIWSSATHVEPGEGPLLLGPPIANTQFYLLDERLQPVPVGVIGELFIGGAGLARGYWKRPELTAERFVPSPFRNGRMYRTGDLGRWHMDASGQGRIELLGRTDFQVKVRGYRIELGEIESALVRHPSVREAAVITQTSGAGITRLIGFVEAGSVEEQPLCLVEELQVMLSAALPEYMVPAVILPLPQFPRTLNGKLDRKALPDASVLFQNGHQASERKFVAATTPEEKKLAAVWTEVLSLDRVSITESIFQLGGDSLLIFRIAARCQRDGLQVTAAQIFQHRTIEAIAHALTEVQVAPSNGSKPPARITAMPRANYQSRKILQG